MVDVVLAVGSQQVLTACRPLIRSIRQNIPNAYIHLLTDGVVEDGLVDNVVVVANDMITVSGPYPRISVHTYYRLFIDKLLPDVKKCIYLDWDTIVLKDISDLLEGDDWVIRGVSINHTKYLNAGVLAFNFTEEARRCMDVARSCIGEFADDQICLNRGFAGKTEEVGFEYNCMIGCLEPTDDTRVLHFLGPAKPWHSHPSIKYWFIFGGYDW